MSTRANIIIKDSYGDKLFFYRHSDGYPEGTLPTLNIFMKWLKNDIRQDLQQGSGWLILLGAMEYNTIPKFKTEPSTHGGKEYCDIDTIETPQDWKVGAYEPTTSIHGDIDYLYIIDIDKATLNVYDSWTEKGEGKHKVTIPEKLQLS